MNPRPLLGTLDEQLRGYPEGMQLFGSAGPISDAFIASRNKVDLINGPVGSGKTTACAKRALVSAVRQPPLIGDPNVPNSVRLRRYVLNCWRETYDQVWKTTIPTWKRLLDPEKGIGVFTGSFPRAALHVIDFEDNWGPIQMITGFRAFGEDASPDDLGGMESTDAYLNEMNTLRKTLFVNLFGRVGRDPPRGAIGLPDDPRYVYGRIFGDCNAPSPEDWVYDDFWSPKKPPGYKLFRQPGGLEPDAENIKTVGRQYYIQMMEANASNPWFAKVKVHNKPGYNRDNDIVFEKYDDDFHRSDIPLKVEPKLPVLVGVDNPMQPAAAFCQEMPDGQFRVLAEVALDRGDELDLAEGMKAIMGSPRFKGCEFHVICDPAMDAGEDLKRGSVRSRLAADLGLPVHMAETNNPEARHAPIRGKLEKRLRGGLPAFVVDATNCPRIRKALNGTFHFRTTRGTGDRSSVVKTPDSHVMEACEYASLASGTSAALIRRSELLKQRRKQREEGQRSQGRYNPLQKRARR